MSIKTAIVAQNLLSKALIRGRGEKLRIRPVSVEWDPNIRWGLFVSWHSNAQILSPTLSGLMDGVYFKEIALD